MKTDWYTRFILTVIAAGIAWLCIFGAGPSQVVRADDQPSPPPPVDVNIAAVGGKIISSKYPALPVQGEVEGKGGGFPISVRIRE
jgi:hypothetical protein